VKGRIALGALVILVAYAGWEYARFRRTLDAADLPPIPLDIERSYGGAPTDGDPYTVVVLGDSTAQGIGADSPEETFGALVARRLAGEGTAVRFVNLGVSGATAGEVLAGQVPRVPALEPDLVLLSVGANDVTSWRAADEYAWTMREIVGRLRETGARLAVLNVPAIVSVPLLPLPVRWALDVRTREYNARLRELRREIGFTLVPIYEDTREAFERDRTHFAADEYHPSSKGYALWADVIRAAVRRSVPNGGRTRHAGNAALPGRPTGSPLQDHQFPPGAVQQRAVRWPPRTRRGALSRRQDNHSRLSGRGSTSLPDAVHVRESYVDRINPYANRHGGRAVLTSRRGASESAAGRRRGAPLPRRRAGRGTRRSVRRHPAGSSRAGAFACGR
jgi:lysophospholipase L1-like esterase